MKKTYSKKLDELIVEAINKLLLKLAKSKVESKSRSEKCLKITDDNLMFNLSGGRYLVEIISDNGREIELIDDGGYSYDYSVLSSKDFLEVVDHLLSKK